MKNPFKMNFRNYPAVMVRNCFFLFFLLSCFLLNAQSFSNLSFEYWQGKRFPLFWQHPGVTVIPDSVVKLSGQCALKAVRHQVEIAAGNAPYGLIFQDVETAFAPAVMQGKKLEISVRIKSRFADTSALVAGFIQVMDFQNPANNNIVIGNNIANQDWAASSASVNIGALTFGAKVLMGVIMMGEGEMWVDDYQVKCNQQSPDDQSPRRTDLTEKERRWLASRVIPVSNEILTQPKKFAKKVSGACLVGVGDNVHGSASVIRLKNIISKSLIENEEFTLLAVEDSPCVGEALNQYVSGATDTILEDMNVMYTNADFKKFLSWLREYNKSAVKKVKIFGVDINGRYENQIKYINHSTSNRYAVRLDSIRSILNSVTENLKNRKETGYKILFTEEQAQCYRTNLEKIQKAVDSLKAGNAQKIVLNYYIRNFYNYLTFDKVIREKQMAENINWLLAQYPHEKMIYLAHNVHVGNKKEATGGWLKEALKDKYYIIGCCYFDGTDLYKKYAVGESETVIQEAVSGSYEYLFNQIKENCFYLDLRKLTENSSNQWLFQPMLMREYGVEPFNYYHEFSFTDLRRMYDGVVFIKTSVPL